MTSQYATLQLEHAVVTCVVHDGATTRHPESHFLDLVVNGQSLRTVTATPGPDLVTALNRPWLPSVPAALDELLGRRPSSDLARGRVTLLVCAVDGDLTCGALTTALTAGDTEISWSDFQWEDGISAPRPVEQLDRPITFDRSHYDAAFADAYETVAGFPYDELAHHGRRFLWPWQWGWKPPRG